MIIATSHQSPATGGQASGGAISHQPTAISVGMRDDAQRPTSNAQCVGTESKPGKLVLADGSVFHGKLFGHAGQTVGEVVFTTGMTGYHETLTDPSFAGQIVTMTYPLMGNYGIIHGDEESSRAHPRALLVRQWCPVPSHHAAAMDLNCYLDEQQIVGLAEIDTRALVRRLRSVGTMMGAVVPDEVSDAEAQALCVAETTDWVREVAVQEPYQIEGNGPHVIVIDFGAKQNIIRELQRLGLRITVVPPSSTAEEVLRYHPDGVFLTNGPGDPVRQVQGIETVKNLVGKVPLAGICLGHQILGLALGAKTYKLPFGHRGANHPVQDLATGRVQITSQNHGYAIDEKSLEGTGLVVTHRQLNDNTVEGVKHCSLPAWSVQYHPEGSPGPMDSEHHFRQFYQSLSGKEQEHAKE